MSNIIDLGLLVQEPLIFKDKTGEVYTIPGEITTDFVIKLSRYHQKVGELEDDEKAYELMQLMIIDILNLDKSKNVDMKLIKERFDDIRVSKLIISEMMKHISEIANDPNSKSLKPQE